MAEVTGERYEIGRVLSGGLEAIRRAPAATLGVPVAFMLVQMAIMLIFFGSIFAVSRTGLAAARQGSGFIAAFGIYYVVALAAYFIQQGAVVIASVRALEGQRISFGTALRQGFSRFLPMIGLAIVTGIGFAVSYALLLIPFFLVFIRWSATPALVAYERLGVFDALKRSNALSRGSRWRFFLLMLMGFVLFVLVSIAFVAVLGGFSAFAGGQAAGRVASPLFIILEIVIGIPLITYTYALQASHYLELRRVREGTSSAKLAEVFA